MVGNHVADLVHRYGTDGLVPPALTRYIADRRGYDYNEHGRADNSYTDFVPDSIVERFCLLGPPEAHLERLTELAGLGVDQFAVYLQHDAKRSTLEAYGDVVIPALADIGPTLVTVPRSPTGLGATNRGAAGEST
jgi:alkanesulfonate monooxygenase SsuD/methylene tetrahydromethanopterin reductase-like flavin-dependent oxidoreductase (luciferase family)